MWMCMSIATITRPASPAPRGARPRRVGARPAVVRPRQPSTTARASSSSAVNSVDSEEWHKLSVEDIDAWEALGPR
jgi:hypothetical protein